MKQVDDCLFCKIARGDIPASIVYTDDDFVAFDDIAPQAPVHVLIVPREHFDHLGDDVPPGLAGRLCQVVPRIATIKGVADSGYRTIINTGPDAGQTVPHLHVHVIGGAPMSEGMVRLASDEQG